MTLTLYKPMDTRETNDVFGKVLIESELPYEANQDLRFDMPVVGPQTVELACKAALRGLVISPDSVMLLDREKCIEIAEANNFFILAKDSTV